MTLRLPIRQAAPHAGSIMAFGLTALLSILPLQAGHAHGDHSHDHDAGHAKATAAPASSPAGGTAVVGQKAPEFTLKDLDGKEHSLAGYLAQGKTVVLEWFNPDCPFVKRHHEQTKLMKKTSKNFGGEVVWLAINSGAPGLQGAGHERNVRAKKEYGINYPILLDEAGTVGRAYGAKTTPHMFVIRKDGVLVYAGAIDDDKAGKNPQAVNYVEQALSACKSGKQVEPASTESYGCSVKYASKSM